MKVRIGIDVGKQGAVVALYEDGKIETSAMPLMKGEYDLQAIRKKIMSYADFDTHIVIEDVHSIFGASAKSNFEFGVGVGMIRMAAAMAQIPFTLIQPKMWQKEIFVGIPVIKKPGKREEGRGTLDTKAMALVAVQRLYPKLDLRKSERAENPHEGIVDALCIATYCKLKF